MKKNVLLVLLPLYADWEAAFVAATLNDCILAEVSPYAVKTVGLNGEPVRSIGGLTVTPDYSLETAPDDAAAVLLIGGMSWNTPERQPTDVARPVVPLVQRAMDRNIIVGAICDATTFLGANGWLNGVAHTSNALTDLRRVAGDRYDNAARYIEQQAVRDGNVVTANGTAYLEFAREVLLALDAYPKATVELHYDFYRNGYIDAIRRHPGAVEGI